MKRYLVAVPAIAFGIAVGRSTAMAQDSTAAKPAAEVSYSKDVAPILEKFCASCHNEDDQHPSELYFDSYDMLIKGGKHGKAVVPGNSKESLISQKMSDEPPFGKRMPPPGKRKAPSPEQVELIRAWIDQGAKKN